MASFYRYYDTPDGQDYIKKQYYLTKAVMPLGIYFAFGDVCFGTQPKGWVPTVDRVLRAFCRPMIATLLFEPTVYICTQLRGKDDGFNHVFGAIPVFKYWHTFCPRGQTVWAAFVPAAIALYVLKDIKVKYNFTFHPDAFKFRDNIDNTLFADFWDLNTKPEKFPRSYLTVDEAIGKGIITSRKDAEERGLIF